MKRILVTVILAALLVVTGCAERTDSFQGELEAVHDNHFIVDCSEEMNRGKINVNSIGHGCSVTFSDETIFQDMNGEPLTATDFISGSVVKVVLRNAIDFQKESNKQLEAKEIVIVKEAEPIMLYQFRQEEVIAADIYRGSPDYNSFIAEINDQDQLDKLAAIFQEAEPFSGNATADWNYTVVITEKGGAKRDIEISGGVHVFSDRSNPKSYRLNKEEFMEFIAQYDIE